MNLNLKTISSFSLKLPRRYNRKHASTRKRLSHPRLSTAGCPPPPPPHTPRGQLHELTAHLLNGYTLRTATKGDETIIPVPPFDVALSQFITGCVINSPCEGTSCFHVRYVSIAVNLWTQIGSKCEPVRVLQKCKPQW